MWQINTQLIAHRGASAIAPENTLHAFQKAHELGARWVEFDVMLTQDDVPIIMHDVTLDRTTNGRGAVADVPHTQIQTLDAGSWFDPQFAGEPVPTFKTLLELLRELDMKMVVEIKPTPGRGHETAKITLDYLYAYWPMDEKPPILSSYDPVACQTVADLAPELVLGCVVDTLEEIDGAFLCPVVSVNHEIVDPAALAQLKQRFDLVLAYTVNDRARADALFALGVDAVFSDVADLI